MRGLALSFSEKVQFCRARGLSSSLRPPRPQLPPQFERLTLADEKDSVSSEIEFKAWMNWVQLLPVLINLIPNNSALSTSPRGS